jgi:RNA methyltransferase, TrmH family
VLSKTEIKRLHGLARHAGRAETGLFLAEGVRLVEELLASPVVPHQAVITSSLEDTPRGAALAGRLRERMPVVEAAEHQLAAIADTAAPQGVAVVAAIPRWRLEDLPLAERELGVVLDGVQDPGNFGTIVRSADAFGAAWVCTLPGTVDPWNPKAVRSAAGSSLRVPIVETTQEQLKDYLSARGFRTLGADMAGAPVGTAGHDGPAGGAVRVALVLGNEGAGLRPETRSLLDGTVSVPVRRAIESLNVGVAAGILLYELSRES